MIYHIYHALGAIIMRFRDLNWMDIERYLQSDHRLIITLGSTKQHAYLSLLTDTLIVEKIADAAAERERVVIAPPLSFGISDVFAEFPGGMGISAETFHLILSELIEMLIYHGFTRILILNGNETNTLPPRVADLQSEGLVRIIWHDWWLGDAMRTFEAKYDLHADHANWGENFPFCRVGAIPQMDKPRVNLDRLEAGETIRDILGDGSYGGPYQVDDKLMFELFDMLVEEVCALLRSLKKPE